MKITKSKLKQLIKEELQSIMEAEEMEAEVEETEGEGLDFDNLPSGVYEFPSNYWITGPERDRAKEEDPGMKDLEDHVMEGGEGLILGKNNGSVNVLIVFRDVNPFTGLDRGVGWGTEGWSGGGTKGGLNLSPERALDYLKSGAELIEDPAVKSAFMSVTEEDLENMPDNTYFVAKTKKKEPEKERPKSRPSRRYDYEDERDDYHDSPAGIARRQARQAQSYLPQRSRRGRRRFEENKLTQSRLKQMIREEIKS